MGIQCAIVTPTAEALAIECDEVVAPGANGEVGLMPGHIPLITALRPGVLTVVKGGSKTYYAVATGFAEIEDDTVRILTASCEEASAIDTAQAQADLSAAESEFAKLSPEDKGYAATQRRIMVSQARLDAAAR